MRSPGEEVDYKGRTGRKSVVDVESSRSLAQQGVKWITRIPRKGEMKVLVDFVSGG
jgi:hypothetical protein